MPDPTPTPTPEEAAKKPKGDEEAGTQPKPEDAPKFTQKDQDALAQKIRREEKEKFDKRAAEEKRLADEAKAKEQGEFQLLADNRQKELEELKPKLETTSQELETYKSKLSEMVTEQLEALPEEVKDVSPAQFGEDKSLLNPLDVIAWLPNGRKLAERINGGPIKFGAGRDPKPTGGTPQQAFEHSKQQLQSSGKYGF